MKDSNWILLGGLAVVGLVVYNEYNKTKDAIGKAFSNFQVPSFTLPDININVGDPFEAAADTASDVVKTVEDAVNTATNYYEGYSSAMQATGSAVADFSTAAGQAGGSPAVMVMNAWNNYFKQPSDTVPLTDITNSILGQSVGLQDNPLLNPSALDLPMSSFDNPTPSALDMISSVVTAASRVVTSYDDGRRTVQTTYQQPNSQNTYTTYVSTVPETNDPFLQIIQDIGGGSHYRFVSPTQEPHDDAKAAAHEVLLGTLKTIRETITMVNPDIYQEGMYTTTQLLNSGLIYNTVDWNKVMSGSTNNIGINKWGDSNRWGYAQFIPEQDMWRVYAR